MTTKKKILFVGENPLGFSGNSHMMRAILSQVNQEEYDLACFCTEFNHLYGVDIFTPLPISLISAAEENDPWGHEKLVSVISTCGANIVVFVGIDIWRYAQQFPIIAKLRDQKDFKWAAIFPYDLQMVRKDWVNWINMLDYPCVYSRHGEELLKERVPNIRYFRPCLDGHEIFVSYDEEEREKRRKLLFEIDDEELVIFGFVGNNQIRKDPQKAIKAFELVKRSYPNIMLYFHMNISKGGVFNIRQALKDTELRTGSVVTKADKYYPPKNMVDMFNAIDVLLNCSYQEGLSWTLVEAMLCGTPIIATDTTAQTELIKDVGILVPCEDHALVPIFSETGESWIEAKQCKVEDLAEAMIKMIEDRDFRKQCKEKGLQKGKEWVDGISDINLLLDEISNTPSIGQKQVEAILFAQHSAAGDVLMTTRCFKGIKERHGGSLPIVYMTLPQYMNIVRGNPYIDNVIPWDENNLQRFKFLYNPHGDRIAPGHWGRNCNSILSDFYWKILGVEPDDFYIEKKKPEGVMLPEGKPICCLHTTGGDKQFRTYKYMGDIAKGLDGKYFTIQVGGGNDYPANGVDLDLRGKLTYCETAWVMDKASLAVTVDSFMSHLAGAIGVSQVCLFGSGNAVVTRPNQVKGQLICLSPDYIRFCPGLGPCSAAVKDCPMPCTGAHDPESILKSISEIENNNMVRRNTEHETSLCVFKHAE